MMLGIAPASVSAPRAFSCAGGPDMLDTMARYAGRLALSLLAWIVTLVGWVAAADPAGPAGRLSPARLGAVAAASIPPLAAARSGSDDTIRPRVIPFRAALRGR